MDSIQPSRLWKKLNNESLQGVAGSLKKEKNIWIKDGWIRFGNERDTQ